MPHLMTDKSIKTFLIEIYENYLEKNGYSIHKLSENSFPLHYISKNELFSEINGAVKTPLSILYFDELKARGWMEKKGMGYYLTANGFTEGYKIKHPLKYFWSVHWRWGVATVIAALGFVSTIIYRYGSICVVGS